MLCTSKNTTGAHKLETKQSIASLLCEMNKESSIETPVVAPSTSSRNASKGARKHKLNQVRIAEGFTHQRTLHLASWYVNSYLPQQLNGKMVEKAAFLHKR